MWQCCDVTWCLSLHFAGGWLTDRNLNNLLKMYWIKNKHKMFLISNAEY